MLTVSKVQLFALLTSISVEMQTCLILLVILQGISFVASFQKCEPRSYGKSNIVCVCNRTYCDTIDPVKKVVKGSFLKYTSNQDGLRFEPATGNFTASTNSTNTNKILIDSNEMFQSIMGFGGALSDSTCINILSLRESVKEKLMRSYFSREGIEYGLARIPMAATDFSTRLYSYHEQEDPLLRNFTLAPEDYTLKIPLLKWAKNLTNNKLDAFVSTWIVPYWMKTNNNYTRGTIRKKYHQTYASYFVKFLDAYQKEGIEFWGITTGNEPNSGEPNDRTRVLPVIAWSPCSQKDWITRNLGPSIRKSSHSGIKIILLDDQRTYMAKWMNIILRNREANNYIDGVALHWYRDVLVPARQIVTMHQRYPDKFIMSTEATQGSFSKNSVQLGSWARAEKYAASIIEDLNHRVTAWMDWNMVLNLQGGPTVIGNFCDSPVIVNATAQEFYKQPMFYAIGHFSKFVPKGSRNIATHGFSSNVPVIAFKRSDDGMVVIILNREEKMVETILEDTNRGNIILNLTPKSLTTLVYW